MKTYVLTISRYFPTTHKRAGEKTCFIDSIYFGNKKHTIRSNYDLWAKRIKAVQEGKAILSVRYWSGKPYHKDENGVGQVEVCQLDKSSGLGVQKIRFPFPNLHCFLIDDIEHQDMSLSKNDGLSYEDFKEWFKKYDLSKPMAIIHFTDFRY